MTQTPSSSDNSTDPFKEISSWVSSTHELDQHLELILGTVSQMMRARIVSLMLVDRSSGKLFLQMAMGETGPILKKREMRIKGEEPPITPRREDEYTKYFSNKRLTKSTK